MPNPLLMALFKTLQQSNRRRDTTKDTLGQMFQQGFRPRAGATGMQASAGGVGGFLQQMLGGGPEIDYSQFEGPPQLVGGPRGSVSRVGDQGRGTASEVIVGETPRRFNDPVIEQGKLVQIDPETNRREVLGDAPAESGKFVRFFEVGGSVYGITDDGTSTKILTAPTEEPTVEGSDIEVGEGNDMGMPPGVYRKKGAGFVKVRNLEPAPPRPAGDVEAARQAWVNVDQALKDGDLDEQQRAQLEGLRNELINAFPEVARQGLDIPGASGASGAAARVKAVGGPADSPGIISDLVRDVGQLLERRRRYQQSPAQRVQEMGQQ